jgi:hypothetical protein
MKVLTVISALFMPISFVVGFFGMNFEGLPFANNWLMAGALGTVLVTPFVMLYWFTRRGWLAPSQSQEPKSSLPPAAAAWVSQRQSDREVSHKTFHRQEFALGDGKEGDS